MNCDSLQSLAALSDRGIVATYIYITPPDLSEENFVEKSEPFSQCHQPIYSPPSFVVFTICLMKRDDLLKPPPDNIDRGNSSVISETIGKACACIGHLYQNRTICQSFWIHEGLLMFPGGKVKQDATKM